MRVLLLVLCLTGNIASAQSFEETLSAAQQQAADLARYQQALQNPDQRVQYSLVQQMLAHPDPGIQRIAKEHALFSTNPVMREAAVKAILDAGSTLRFQVAVTSENTTGVAGWLKDVGGVFDGARGEALVAAPPPIDNDCWGTGGKCTFQQVGNTLQYNYRSIRIVLNLGNDGVLRGSLTYDVNRINNTAQVQVDLKQ